MLKEIAFLVIVLLTNIIQCITGFAGTVLAMPFSIMLVGYDTAKPILNVLGIVASVYILASNGKYIHKKEFLKIVAVMIIGIVGGFFLKQFFTGNPTLLYRTLGMIVIAFAVINAFKFYTKKEDKEIHPAVGAAILIASGVVHGMFVCGGPLLVTYAAAKLKDKNEFRATLSAVWVVLNGIIMVTDIQSGLFTVPTIQMCILSIVVLFVAMYIGNKIYQKMSKSVFLQLTYILMFISGVSLLIK